MKTGLARLVPHLGRLARAERWRRTKNDRASGLIAATRRTSPRTRSPRSSERARPAPTASSSTSALDRDGTVVVFHDAT